MEAQGRAPQLFLHQAQPFLEAARDVLPKSVTATKATVTISSQHSLAKPKSMIFSKSEFSTAL